MASNALTKGDAPSSVESHGRITASRNSEPTKNRAMRMMTELVALLMARSGSRDSAAAMVAISAPTIEKITTTTAEKMAPPPFGNRPPCTQRLLKSRSLFGQKPSTKALPRTRNSTIAATLMPANQYSNSPKAPTENRLVRVIRAIRPRESSHSGASNQ